MINIILKRHRRLFNDDLIFILSINFINRMFIKTINISIIFAIMIFKIMIIKIRIFKTFKNIDQIQINFQTSFCLRRQFVYKLQSTQLLFSHKTRQILTFKIKINVVFFNLNKINFSNNNLIHHLYWSE